MVLCSDEHIVRLNSEWRQKPEATDVLSFPMEQDSGDGCPVHMLGDLVISLDTAQRQADERGYALQMCPAPAADRLMPHGRAGLDTEIEDLQTS